jgi:isopropylmalate/homocitrate/citramalate synthase
VRVVEVGPRDGLQNEAVSLSVEDRAAFCDALFDAGLETVEVGAFVSPTWVPQMAGSEEVFRALRKGADRKRVVLVPNLKGFERAMSVGVREIAVFTAASETFNKKNTNASIAESYERFAKFLPEARRQGLWVRGYISTCFHCPYEGVVRPEAAVEVAKRLRDLGCDEVSIGDTIGKAVPTEVERLLELLRAELPLSFVAVHFHDTRGTALANVLAALDGGIAIVDSSAGGLGGCPYAPGASGNLATEDLLYMLHGMGIRTGVSLDAVVAASKALAPRLGHPLPSRYLQACS